MDSRPRRTLIIWNALIFPLVHVGMGINYLPLSRNPMFSVGAMCLAAVACCLVVFRDVERPRLSASTSVGVLAATLLINVLVNQTLPNSGEHPGYQAWQSGTIQMILVTVALRGRIMFAVIGICVFGVTQFLFWIGQLNLTIMDAAVNVITPVGWVGMAAAMTLALQRSDRVIQRLDRQQERVADQEAAERAYRLTQKRWGEILGDKVRDALSLVSGSRQDLTPAEKGYLRLLDAEIRDTIQARIFMREDISAAVWEARARDITVEFRDQRLVPFEDETLNLLADELIVVLGRAESHATVTVLALAREDDIAATILCRAVNGRLAAEVAIPATASLQ